jgi:hypothetical protein
LRLRSPRDSAVPLVTDVLLDAWDTKPDRPHQEDVSTSSTDTLNALLADVGQEAQQPVDMAAGCL